MSQSSALYLLRIQAVTLGSPLKMKNTTTLVLNDDLLVPVAPFESDFVVFCKLFL